MVVSHQIGPALARLRAGSAEASAVELSSSLVVGPSAAAVGDRWPTTQSPAGMRSKARLARRRSWASGPVRRLVLGAARYLMVGPPAACSGWRRMRYMSGEDGKAIGPGKTTSIVNGTVGGAVVGAVAV